MSVSRMLTILVLIGIVVLLFMLGFRMGEDFDYSRAATPAALCDMVRTRPCLTIENHGSVTIYINQMPVPPQSAFTFTVDQDLLITRGSRTGVVK